MENEGKVLKHFSHRHPLCQFKSKEEDEIVCSGCELDLSGSAYKCTKPNCEFHLHKLCSELPQVIRHKSHPEHPLTLLSLPPYEGSECTCNACGDFGTGFIYQCSTCQFDLHVGCASLPETVDREDHKHPITLVYSFPDEEKDIIFTCDVCYGTLPKRCWAYYCQNCDYCTHLDSATAKAEEDSPDSVPAAQNQLKMLQLQRQHAEMLSALDRSSDYI